MLLHVQQGGSAEIDLKVGHVIKLSINEKYKEIGDENVIYVDYKNIVKVCLPGDIVFVDDGLISLKVTDKNSSSLTTGKGSPVVLVLSYTHNIGSHHE